MRSRAGRHSRSGDSATIAHRPRRRLGTAALIFAIGAVVPRAGDLELTRSADLQARLENDLSKLVGRDADLDMLRVAVVDLTNPDRPLLAEHNGDVPTYPASVVKLVYLLAAYQWRDEGRLILGEAEEELLRAMVHHSSNRATQRVVALLTDTAPGPELPPAQYEEFVRRRLRIKDWLASLGIDDLHCVHPTYDGSGDLYGRDVQFLRDGRVAGGLSGGPGEFRNRQAMTAAGTARLLTLLATGRALAPRSTQQALEHLRRDLATQPHLRSRIAGGALRHPDMEVFSKTGTWGPIFADAGIVRHVSGRAMVFVVFVDRTPAYRGDLIADLVARWSGRLIEAPAE